MSRVRVLIATTEGPAEVQRITEEDRGVKSVICLDGKAIALPVSPAYDAFVRKPTGVIEAAYGHPAYRLDVSRPISSGMSWQLGALVAHALFAAGRLAQKGEAAEQVLWLTGEVDRDLEVLPVRHLGEKLRSAAAPLADFGAAGLPVTLCVPEGNKAELDRARVPELAKCSIQPVASALQVLKHLKLPLIRAIGARAATARCAPGAPAKQTLAWSLLGFATLGVVLASSGWWRSILDPPALGLAAPVEATVPRGLSVAAVETRTGPGETCAAVAFGTAEPRTVESALFHGQMVDTGPAAGLCGFRYRITNGATPARIWVFAARSGLAAPRVKPRALVRARALGPAERLEIEVRLPRRFEDKLLHRLAVVASPQAEPRLDRELAEFSEKLGAPLGFDDWERLVQALDRPGLDLVYTTHAVSP